MVLTVMFLYVEKGIELCSYKTSLLHLSEGRIPLVEYGVCLGMRIF
jgi:hypothetical protein